MIKSIKQLWKNIVDNGGKDYELGFAWVMTAYYCRAQVLEIIQLETAMLKRQEYNSHYTDGAEAALLVLIEINEVKNQSNQQWDYV